jgi:hypothetical protein
VANKRMFSKQITESDAFLDMPVSSQLLYFHLNMGADDDGFVANPKRIMRMVGVQGDDLNILLAKRFLLAFKNGVVVIKHWLLHNCVRKDMYKETQYLEEKKQLKIKDNSVYTEERNETVTNPLHRIDKVRLDKDRLDKITIVASDEWDFEKYLETMKDDKRHIQVIRLYWLFKGYRYDNKLKASSAIKRELRPAQILMGYDDKEIEGAMYYLAENMEKKWTLETVHKYIDDYKRLNKNNG